MGKSALMAGIFSFVLQALQSLVNFLSMDGNV
ncbi:MAG: hypothetical protein ACI9G1_004820, partial [Pirellulaceae bacterium]